MFIYYNLEYILLLAGVLAAVVAMLLPMETTGQGLDGAVDDNSSNSNDNKSRRF